MLLSKSFGYALRGLLYIAFLHDENRKVQTSEIAAQLSVPKHFLGKIMQQLVKKGLLNSAKGPNGGFSLTEKTLSTPLTILMEITHDMDQFRYCVLKLKACNNLNPCPLHSEMEEIKNNMLEVFSKKTLGDLLTDNKNTFIKSLSIT